MSEILKELRATSEAINKTLINLILAESSSIQNELINIKKCVDSILGCAENDFDVTHKMLMELLKLCSKCNTPELDWLLNHIKTLCSENLAHRNKLCIEMINGFFNIKYVAKPSLDIKIFVESETVLAFQHIFNSEDVMGSIIQCDHQGYIEKLKESGLFSPHVLFVNLTQYQKGLEENFIAFAKARESLMPKRFDAGDFAVTVQMRERFTALNKYGANPFSQSAPTTPVNREKMNIVPSSLSNRETSSSHHASSTAPVLAPSFQLSKVNSVDKKNNCSKKHNRHNVPHLPLHTLHMCTESSQQYQHQDHQNVDLNIAPEQELSSCLAKLIIDDMPTVSKSMNQNTQSLNQQAANIKERKRGNEKKKKYG